MKIMNLYALKYFKTGDGICGGDFENRDKVENINLEFLLSLSNIKKFELPLSGRYVDEYATVTMSNSDRYHIRKDEYAKLLSKLPSFTTA